MADAQNLESVINRRLHHLRNQSVFSEHAAPVAILSYLHDAHAARSQLDHLIDWLSHLHGRREAEQAAGVWPAAVKEER